MRELAPGLTYAALVSVASYFLGKWLPSLGDVTLAIILGLSFSNLFGLPASAAKGCEFCEKKLQSVAVVLMGFSLSMTTIAALGLRWVALLFIMILFTLSLSRLLAPRFGVNTPLALLVGMGNAICGSSAIAASSSLLRGSKEDVGISIGVINLLGTLGIFALPVLARLAQLEPFSASLLVGGSLQAVNQVVAAGYGVAPSVGEMAVGVKMARIFLLGPTLLLLSFVLRSAGERSLGKSFLALPTYLYGFVACVALYNSGWLPGELVSILQKASHLCLLVAMAGIGLRLRLATLWQQAPRALAFGSALFLLQMAALWLAISNFAN